MIYCPTAIAYCTPWGPSRHPENLRLLKGSVGTGEPSERVALGRDRMKSSVRPTGSVPSLQTLGFLGSNLVKQ
jgi:hypothetical protein